MIVQIKIEISEEQICFLIDKELSSVDSDFESDYDRSAEEIASGCLTTAENLQRFHLSETVLRS